ncbi:MAG: DUF4105 domain-containing protein [Bdellovibrionaceae bacterium]|nr:DUF4105 domain-containing protein [Pseudobdellovibrionaceae bacterium]
MKSNDWRPISWATLTCYMILYTSWVFASQSIAQNSKSFIIPSIQPPADSWQDVRLRLKARNRSLLEKFEQSDVKGVELIIAGPSSLRVESRFGHAFLHFIDDNTDFSNDFVISLIADVTTPEVDFIKGVAGGYPAAVEVERFSSFFVRYLKNENRSLTRYPLLLTKHQISKLVDQIRVLAKNPDKIGRYYFVGKNCSSMLAHILADSGLELTRPFPQTPMALVSNLEFNLYSPVPPQVISPPSQSTRRVAKQLGLQPEDFGRLNAEQAQSLFSKIDTLSLSRMRENSSDLSLSALNELNKIYVSRQERPTVEQIYGYNYLPDAVYAHCARQSGCFVQMLRSAHDLWTDREIKYQIRKNELFLRIHSPMRILKKRDFDHIEETTNQLRQLLRNI